MRIRLGAALNLNEISIAAHGFCPPEIRNTYVECITTDTRDMEKGDLFIPLKGNNLDGERFCPLAIERGAFVISRFSYECAITVDDTETALLLIAKYYKNQYLKDLKFTVGVTGSVGKTTTKEFLCTLCKEKYRSFCNEGNKNSIIGLPLTVLSCPTDCEALILEMGMNHSHEIEKMSLTVEPNIGIITNIGLSHVGNLGSREKIASAKKEILRGMGEGVVLCDIAEGLLADLPNRITVSTTDYSAVFYLRVIEYSFEGAYFDLYFREKCIKGLYCAFGAPHNLNNLSFALCAFMLMGGREEDIKRSLPSMASVQKRNKIIPLGAFTVYEDCYNASFESIISAIKHIKMLNKPFSALIGDIYELGSYSEKIHKEIGKELFNLGARQIFTFGEYSKFIREGALDAGMNEESIFINEDLSSPEISARQIINALNRGEILLIKGSNATKADRITRLLQKELKNDGQ